MTLTVQEEAPLAPLTTLGVGGPARWLIEADDEGGLREALGFARSRGAVLHVLGGGSNLLVADRGIDGVVLRARLRGITVTRTGAGRDARVLVRVGGGEPWDALVERATQEGWAGIECLSGIPGEVGATPIQNVGAYGQEVAETIVAVEALDRGSGEAVTLSAAQCRFGYRDSAFKREVRGRYLVTAVTFALTPGGAAAVRYPELRRALGETAASPPLAEVRAVVLRLRRSKSMVLDPADENGRSAGSFFMNPTLAAASFAAVRARVEAAGVLSAGESMPTFPGGEGRVKVPAAWLIERAGFAKGTTSGRAGISTKHALALVNRGGATAEELVALAVRIRGEVRARFGVALLPEPDAWGFTAEELAALSG
ncbi:UDP-N-acetylmuramate dehydrogenase [Chondromyces crocatus]|uniref:UDP-N-acetylenolpyruvoylglucosamine reductase n=1 Tax=Chondromyces crocatus TaxID=52 RepID=A0A0K1E696_CHOCO|nr:UDP-N-acetylmuramate dehydrogenase [Chondromyces crocatus]AKT36379.1 UDP-N-acetylenolpyruvoylglucosamine reductase [Chondromyces crocatus]